MRYFAAPLVIVADHYFLLIGHSCCTETRLHVKDGSPKMNSVETFFLKKQQKNKITAKKINLNLMSKIIAEAECHFS